MLIQNSQGSTQTPSSLIAVDLTSSANGPSRRHVNTVKKDGRQVSGINAQILALKLYVRTGVGDQIVVMTAQLFAPRSLNHRE